MARRADRSLFVRAMPLNRLTQKLLARFPAQLRRLERRGQIVPGVDADTVIIVAQGALAVEFAHPHTERLIVDVVSPASGVLHCRSLASAGDPIVVRTLMPTTYVRVALAQLDRLIAEDHEIARLLAMELCNQVGELHRRVALLDEPDVHRCVLGAMQYLHAKIGGSCPLASGRILQVPQTVVASVAGLSRQTVNRVLRDLQKRGLIRAERAMICLLDPPGIDRLSRGERLPYALQPCTSCQFMNPDAPFDCSPAKRKRLPLPA